MEGEIYTHPKGGTYVVLAEGEVKIDGKWTPSVTYTSVSVDDNKWYTRKRSDFLSGKFVKVEK